MLRISPVTVATGRNVPVWQKRAVETGHTHLPHALDRRLAPEFVAVERSRSRLVPTASLLPVVVTSERLLLNGLRLVSPMNDTRSAREAVP